MEDKTMLVTFTFNSKKAARRVVRDASSKVVLTEVDFVEHAGFVRQSARMWFNPKTDEFAEIHVQP